MQIEVYTRPGCSRCVTLKETLKSINVGFAEYVIDENITRDEVVEKFPNCKMLPIVTMNSNLIDSDKLLSLLTEKKI